MLDVLTPAVTNDLASVTTIKAELQIGDASQDAYLATLIREASGLVSVYCGRVLVAETVRETFRLDRSRPSLILSRFPVVTVTSVVADGVTLTTDDYEVDRDAGTLWRLSDDARTAWTARKVVVTYTAGLSPIPADIERATVDLVKLAYFSRSRDPALRSEKILDVIDTAYQVTATSPTVGGLPADIAARLDRYRSPSVA